jgi:hypothetical protein
MAAGAAELAVCACSSGRASGYHLVRRPIRISDAMNLEREERERDVD